MSKKANPKVVGSFVLGAAVIGIFGVMLLGGGNLMADRFVCILYFDESISGLDVGAPVDFQGVRIGTVTSVSLEIDRETGDIYRPVLMQIEGNRLHYTTADRLPRSRDDEGMEALVVKRGLRARLATQSMLTGKLKIELGYFPDRPVVRSGRESVYWEMPTMPSPLREVTDEVAHLPLAEIVQEAHRALQGLADTFSSERTDGPVRNLNNAIAHMTTILVTLEKQVEPLSGQANQVMGAATEAINELNAMMKRIEPNLEPLLVSLHRTSESVATLLEPDSEGREELYILIADLRETSRAVRRLADQLEQHPESILRGRQ